MGSVVASPYDGHVNPVYYNVQHVSTGNVITGTIWQNIYNVINTERARRGNAGVGNPGFTGLIEANDLNTLTSAINYHWGDGYVNVGNVVTASNINYVIDKLNYAGSVCLCDCNYCTCNCNYCTCNCDYACTCNCNYSDFRLKTNIKFLRKENGISIYSFNYIWDLTKLEEGVIAQEILKTKFKHAVIKESSGFYKVNYSLLPICIKGH